MRVSGGGHDILMIVVPTLIVFFLASGLAGGPDRVVRLLAGYVTDVLASARDWIRWTLL